MLIRQKLNFNLEAPNINSSQQKTQQTDNVHKKLNKGTPPHLPMVVKVATI
jgi:hypothetical protein